MKNKSKKVKRYLSMALAAAMIAVTVPQAAVFADDATPAGTTLATPVKPAWNNGILSWDAVENAETYDINLYKDGMQLDTFYSDEASIDLTAEITEYATYTAAVVANADGFDSSAQSPVSAEYDANKIQPVSANAVTDHPGASNFGWGTAAESIDGDYSTYIRARGWGNAHWYLQYDLGAYYDIGRLKFFSSSMAIPVNIYGSMDNNEWKLIANLNTKTSERADPQSYEASNFKNFTARYVRVSWDGGNWDGTLGPKNQYTNFDEVKIYGVEKEIAQLPKVQNLTWTNGVLSWGAVEGAEGYTVKLYKDGVEKNKIEVSETTADLSEYTAEAGTYTALVRATATDCISEYEKSSEYDFGAVKGVTVTGHSSNSDRWWGSPENTLDGNYGSFIQMRGGIGNGVNRWLVYDLGEIYDISRIKMYSDNAFPKPMNIYASSDGTNYKIVNSISDATGETVSGCTVYESKSFKPFEARYIKVQYDMGNTDGTMGPGTLSWSGSHYWRQNETKIYGSVTKATISNTTLNVHNPDGLNVTASLYRDGILVASELATTGTSIDLSSYMTESGSYKAVVTIGEETANTRTVEYRSINANTAENADTYRIYSLNSPYNIDRIKLIADADTVKLPVAVQYSVNGETYTEAVSITAAAAEAREDGTCYEAAIAKPFTATYIKLVCEEGLNLKNVIIYGEKQSMKPMNLVWEGTRIMWDDIILADSYDITLYRDGVKIFNTNTQDDYYDFETEIAEKGTYYVTVTSKIGETSYETATSSKLDNGLLDIMTATAVSSDGATNAWWGSAAATTDGDFGSYIEIRGGIGENGLNRWLAYDMGEECNISKIKFYTSGVFPTPMNIYASNDGRNYRIVNTIYEATGEKEGTSKVYEASNFNNFNARYIKVQYDLGNIDGTMPEGKTHGYYGAGYMRINEVKIYGSECEGVQLSLNDNGDEIIGDADIPDGESDTELYAALYKGDKLISVQRQTAAGGTHGLETPFTITKPTEAGKYSVRLFAWGAGMHPKNRAKNVDFTVLE